jgi:hypothetical protein
MDYDIQLWVNPASKPPKIVYTRIEKGRSLEDVKILASAVLRAAVVNGKIDLGGDIIDLASVGPDAVGPDAVFVRVVEIEGGRPTERVVFQRTLAEGPPIPDTLSAAHNQ